MDNITTLKNIRATKCQELMTLDVEREKLENEITCLTQILLEKDGDEDV